MGTRSWGTLRNQKSAFDRWCACFVVRLLVEGHAPSSNCITQSPLAHACPDWAESRRFLKVSVVAPVSALGGAPDVCNDAATTTSAQPFTCGVARGVGTRLRHRSRRSRVDTCRTLRQRRRVRPFHRRFTASHFQCSPSCSPQCIHYARWCITVQLACRP